jgi:D-galactose 1-dehydrogenase
MTAPVRLAVIGAGKIARDQHLPALAASDRFEAVALVDPRDPELALPCFPSIEALLGDGPRVDTVAICTPPRVREDIARRAIAAGLHVRLEKPPAATVTAARQLLDAAAPGQTLFAAWHSREAPMGAAATEWLGARRIARGHMRWREDARVWHPGQHWLWQPGGLGVFDTAINGFSILTAISRQRFAVAEARFQVPCNQQAPIAAEGVLRCDSGTIAFDLDFREPGASVWELALETDDGGTMHLSHGGGMLVLDGAAPVTGIEAEYPALYRRFAELIASGQSDVDTAPLALVADTFLIAQHDDVEAYHP